jgi:hypothetical protein
MTPILEKIYTILSTDATLQTLVGGGATDKRIYPFTVDEPEEFPCVTYENIGGDENSVPINTQEIEIELRSYSKKSMLEANQIMERVKVLIRYLGSDSPRIYWSKKTLEIDNPSNDRNLKGKITRFRFWSKIA